ncbi:MAG: putative transporter [Chloroflexi bacterium ADurb.Bin325]|nr:MAG: putative transporter [Chloroflexi bacterium ADurb.Bin325]
MTTFTRDRFTWLAYLFLAFYGYFLNVLGPITPYLKAELGLSYTVSSLHFTAFATGILAVGLVGHVLIRRVGRAAALWIGAFGMSLGALLLLAGRSPVVTIAAAFCTGLVGSLILAIVPAALADRHGEGRAIALSEANVIASIACALAPLMVGWAAGLPGGWRLALALAAGAPILMYLGFRRATPPPAAAAAAQRAARALPRGYWVYWAALMLAVSIEFCMIFWSADYLETGLGLRRVDAVQAVSLFLVGMIVGRLAGSRLVQRYPARGLVLASTLVAAAGFLLFWTTGDAALGLLGLTIAGLGVASLYPLILALALGAAGADTVQAGARATLASGTAILALPLVLGRLADLAGIRPAYGVVAVLLAGVFGIIAATAARRPVQQPT